MKPAILTLLFFLSDTVYLCGQTKNQMFNFREEIKDTSFSGRHYGNRHIYHFNEIQKLPEINIYRHDKGSQDLNFNRFYQYGMKFSFHNANASLKEGSVFPLPLDNMPCLIPDKKGKIIITEPDHSVIYL